jgi:hypothetical protein
MPGGVTCLITVPESEPVEGSDLAPSPATRALGTLVRFADRVCVLTAAAALRSPQDAKRATLHHQRDLGRPNVPVRRLPATPSLQSPLSEFPSEP